MTDKIKRFVTQEFKVEAYEVIHLILQDILQPGDFIVKDSEGCIAKVMQLAAVQAWFTAAGK